MSFVCIYCRGCEPNVTPSESHVFPHVLGGEATITDVCRDCNNAINEQVEQAALPFFAFHRSIFGIRGRRGDVPAVRAVVEWKGTERPVLLGASGEAIHPIVERTVGEHGTPSYTAFAPGDVLDQWQAEMSKKNPGLRWQDREHRPITAWIEFGDVGALALRRLAAKAAFEWFTKLRGTSIVLGDDFDPVRSFIREGLEPEPVAGVLSDEALLFGPLTFPVPSHAAYVVGHPLDRVVGAFVAFFGMHYFWVLLSNKYAALAPFDEPLLEYPQERTHENPQLRRRNETPRVAWANVTRPWLEHMVDTSESAKRSAGRKFSAAADEFYDALPS
jgi:hypothetical protein